jgi:RNA polymerase sigma-70 factor (ECF subfamily)
MRAEESEEALMQAYVEGDVDAFERLFQSLAPSLRAFFTRSTGNASAADDLVQTTLLKMHAARRRWRRGERLRPWVFTIAARVRVDWLRSQGRLGADALDEEALPATDAAVDPSSALGDRERSARVQAAIDALTEPQRVVVHLHRFEELSFAEIGEILHISEGAAKLRAFRAYAELRKRLGDLVAEDAS